MPQLYLFLLRGLVVNYFLLQLFFCVEGVDVKSLSARGIHFVDYLARPNL